MENKKKEDICFGVGFRSVKNPSVPPMFPSCAPKEISLSLDVTDKFRIECDDPKDASSPVRIRSDISMLLHAADTAKKIGTPAMNYLMDSKRSRTSSIQSAVDSLNVSDSELLATVKSRHLQSPSEILAWSECISDLAAELKSKYLNEVADDTSDSDSGSSGSGSSDPSES